MTLKRIERRTGVVGLALAAVLLAMPAHGASIDEIDGYGPFRFGMSVADAMRAAPQARLLRCDFPARYPNCVEFDDKVYGIPARVRARFGADQKLDAVFVQFDQLAGAPGSQACHKVSVAAYGRLRDSYGPDWRPKKMEAPKPDAARSKQAAKRSGKAAAKDADEKDAAAQMAAFNTAVENVFADLSVWFPAKGGKVGLVDLCADNDAGIVYLIFTPSTVPGEKAS